MSLKWYLNICRQLKAALGDAVTFMFLTDGTEEELRDFVDEFQPITNFGQPYAVVSDLLALATADVLVCSISSYSMWGAVLSRAPYFWYLPNLQRLNGHLTLWQEYVHGFGDNTNGEEILPRGIPMAEDSRIPDNVLEYLRMKIKLNSQSLDLIKSGGIPVNYETVLKTTEHKCITT